MSSAAWRAVYEIGARPKRRHLPLEPEEVFKSRKLYCIFYEKCLHYAMLEDWVSWVCTECPIEEEISMDDKRSQAFEIVKYLKSERGGQGGG